MRFIPKEHIKIGYEYEYWYTLEYDSLAGHIEWITEGNIHLVTKVRELTVDFCSRKEVRDFEYLSYYDKNWGFRYVL